MIYVATRRSAYPNQAALFDGTGTPPMHLNIATNSDLETGDIQFHLGCWLYLSDKSITRAAMGKYDHATLGNREYGIIYYQPSDRLAFFTASAFNDQGNVLADQLGSPSLNTWYFVSAWHDSSANQVGIRVNNLTADTAAFGFGVRAGATAFRIGSERNDTQPWVGRIDEAFLYKNAILDTSAMNALYNNDVGLAYSDLSAGQKTSLVSWWGLNDNTWVDSHGNNDLTASGAVTNITGKR